MWSFGALKKEVGAGPGLVGAENSCPAGVRQECPELQDPNEGISPQTKQEESLYDHIYIYV